MSTTPLQPDIIPHDQAGTLPGLFLQRINRSPDQTAYRQFDRGSSTWRDCSWSQASLLAARFQRRLEDAGLNPGDRVAILLHNSIEWVCFDQAALGLGLVTVPLYTTDAPESIAFILADCCARLLLVDDAAAWEALLPFHPISPCLETVLCLDPDASPETTHGIRFEPTGVRFADDRAGAGQGSSFDNRAGNPRSLATIVYTSGTTGRPKGVMLSHRNILWNAEAVLRREICYREDLFLSFLPLSHTFERTVGDYLPVMAGCTVAFARSIQELAEDLITIKPTVLVSVPRIFERVHGKIRHGARQKGKLAERLLELTVATGWRRFEARQGIGRAGLLDGLLWPLLRHVVADKVTARLGGRLRLAVSGGAPLHEMIARFFIGLGVPLLQGYGLTEASPVVSANRLEHNRPASVGAPLPGVEIRLGERSELLVRSPGVMLGYWNRPEESASAISGDGWLHTGDQVELIEGDIHIRGRIKEILVTSTGEKVAPADMEMAITQDPLFEMAMVTGEGKPFLAALVVLNEQGWREAARALAVDPDQPDSLALPAVKSFMLDRANHLLRGFPGHARVRAISLTLTPWSVADGLLTPTLKLKRPVMLEKFAPQISAMYTGHEMPL